MSQEPPSHHDSWNPPAAHELEGEFPALEIRSLLARGGMSAVYLAQQKSLERAVVLKILAPETGNTEGAAERFQREARILARLRDPGIVEIYDSGVSPSGYLYLILEYVAGGDLRQWARRGTVSLDDVLGIGESVAAALSAAHSAGVVHGDIKPDNVFIDVNGRLKVGDFGLADFAELVQSTHYTPGYTAPEILHDTGRVTPVSDIYAVGAMMAELIFPGLNPEDIQERDAQVATLPEAARWAIQRALQPAPEDRPATAAAFREELSQARRAAQAPPAVTGPQGVVRPPVSGRRDRSGDRGKGEGGQRTRTRMAVLAAIAAGGVGLLVWKPWVAPPAAPVPAPDQQAAVPAATSTSPTAATVVAKAPEKPADQASVTPPPEASTPPQETAAVATVPGGPADAASSDAEADTANAASDFDSWLAAQSAQADAAASKIVAGARADEESIRAWNPDWKVEAPMGKESNAARFDHPENGRQVLMLSPYSTSKPSAFTRTLSLPADQPMQLSARVGAYWGPRADWELRAFADSQPLGSPYIISTAMPQGRFRDVVWDLSPWRGKTVELRVEGATGGNEIWYYEFSYWAGLKVEPLNRRPPAETAMDPAQAASGPLETGFVNLLDAEHAGNWKASGPGGLVLWEGVATTFTRPRKPAEGLCWYSGKPFGDYVLRMEFKLDTPQANSGILIACPVLENNASPSSRGNAVEIDISGYDIKKLGTASIAWSKLPNTLPLKRDDWNQYEITVTGSKCRVRLNGQDVNEYDAGRSLGGYIALQHRWSDGEVRFRNVHLRELAPFRPDAVVASAGGLSTANPSSAALAGKLPPEADAMMRKLRAFASERRASLRQSINTGRRQLAGTFRTAAKGDQREVFAAEARRVESLDAGKELLDEDGVHAWVWKGAPEFLGNWKDSKSALVFTFNPNGKGSTNERGPLQWRCLDDDPQRLVVVHWGDDWVNLGHFSKGIMKSINWNGLRFQRNKIAESPLLSKPGMEWTGRTVRQEHEAADKTDAAIKEKAQAVRDWLRAQLKTAPAPVLSAALAQVDAVSNAAAPRPGTPEDQRYPEGVWVAGERRLEFGSGGELTVDRSLMGKWIWATDEFQKMTVAFCYDEGDSRVVGLARQSSKDDDLLRVYLLTGSGLSDARRDRSPGADAGGAAGLGAAVTLPAKKMLMGHWTWHGVGKPVRIEFLPDGKVINPIADNGSWKQVGDEKDRCFEFHWNNGTDITAVLSADGLSIDAVRSDGFKIKGVKIVKP